jgi:hypothetical protein
MPEHTIETLAEALYEGRPSLQNLAESMARQYGKAGALSFFGMMGEDVQFFWKDIARQIIEHSKEWQENEGCACVLSEKEHKRLRNLRLHPFGVPAVLCKDRNVCPYYPNGCHSGCADYIKDES